MRKKLIRTTAMLLAATMTLTSCSDIGKKIPFIGGGDSSEESNKSEEKENTTSD